MTEQLKPCPFCGDKALKTARFNMGYSGDGIKCTFCKAETPSYLVGKKAIDWWNTRANGWIGTDVEPELHQAVLCKTEYADGTPAALIRHWNGKSGFLGEGGKKDKFVKGWMPLPSVE